MPLFDAYVMIDWSGGDGRRAGKADCLWIAQGCGRRDRHGPRAIEWISGRSRRIDELGPETTDDARERLFVDRSLERGLRRDLS